MEVWKVRVGLLVDSVACKINNRDGMLAHEFKDYEIEAAEVRTGSCMALATMAGLAAAKPTDGNLRNAIEAIPDNTNNVSGYVHGINQKPTLEELDKLISKLSQVIQLNPKNAEARRKRAEFYFYKGEFANCISDSSEVIRLVPEDAPTFVNRGNANFETGEIDKAISDYTTALKLGAPGGGCLCASRGRTPGKANLDKAISDYDEAIRLEPKLSTLYDGRGDVTRT